MKNGKLYWEKRRKRIKLYGLIEMRYDKNINNIMFSAGNNINIKKIDKHKYWYDDDFWTETLEYKLSLWFRFAKDLLSDRSVPKIPKRIVLAFNAKHLLKELNND